MPKPPILDVGFRVYAERLWKLDLPTEEMPLKDLEHNLDFAYLDKQGTDDWNLTPRELLQLRHQEPEHWLKVEKADLSYPIEIYDHDGTWIILDGVHRFTKAALEELETLPVRKVSRKKLLSLRPTPLLK